MGIEIKSPADLAQLTSSIIRKLELLTDPVRVCIEIDGPDEMRYTLLITPNYVTQGTPTEVKFTTGLNLNVAQDKE